MEIDNIDIELQDNAEAASKKKKPPKKKKNRKLLLQVGFVAVIVFMLALFSIALVIYGGSTDLFLSGKSDMIQRDLKHVKSRITSIKSYGFLLDFIEEHYTEIRVPFTEEESKALDRVYFSCDENGLSELSSEDARNYSEIEQMALAKELYQWIVFRIDDEKSSYNYDELYVIDVMDPDCGFVFFEGIQSEEDDDETTAFGRELGQVWYYEPEDHEAVRKFRSGKYKEYEFELSSDRTDKKDYYIGCTPLVEDNEVKGIICIAYDYDEFSSELDSNLKIMFIVGITGIGISGGILLLYIYFKAIRPLRRVSLNVRRYMEDKDSEAVAENLSKIRTKNEFGALADDITELTRDISKYTGEIRDLIGAQEKVSAELNLAAKIQDDMLPKKFPEHEAFKLYATMDPAKEVGGDFYDFFYIDDDHLGLTIADVSGKGVPAALFMMMSKLLIRNYAMSGLSPAEVLDLSNKSICENNNANMFVTVWFGILEISTGHIVAGNAGHEYPMLRKANGEFELFKDKHDFVLGVMKRKKYKQYEFDIEKGGSLFVYTDGAPEATSADEELFGTDRMLAALNIEANAEPNELIASVKERIDQFVGAAPQFDDLTMMCINFSGADEETSDSEE